MWEGERHLFIQRAFHPFSVAASFAEILKQCPWQWWMKSCSPSISSFLLLVVGSQNIKSPDCVNKFEIMFSGTPTPPFVVVVVGLLVRGCCWYVVSVWDSFFIAQRTNFIGKSADSHIRSTTSNGTMGREKDNNVSMRKTQASSYHQPAIQQHAEDNVPCQ